MKSITIHKLDDDLADVIVERAEAEGLSQNQFIKQVLREALGLDKEKQQRKEVLESFFGTWTKKDLEEFNAEIDDLNQINEADWQ